MNFLGSDLESERSALAYHESEGTGCVEMTRGAVDLYEKALGQVRDLEAEILSEGIFIPQG